MKVIGITGRIGAGKSTLASFFKKNGFPVFNADQCIHNLYKKNEQVIAHISKICPTAFKNGAIERLPLKSAIVQDPSLLKELEKITHPHVLKALILFVKQNLQSQVRLIILDIPLLFNIKGHIICDLVIALTTPLHLQQSRLKTKYKNSLLDIFNKKHNILPLKNKMLLNKVQAALYAKTILAQLNLIKAKNNFFTSTFINQFKSNFY